MNPREELQALRRMAELETRAASTQPKTRGLPPPDISRMGMGATGAQTAPYGKEFFQGPVTLPGAIIQGLGGGAERSLAGITELGARAVGAEGLQQTAKSIREDIPKRLAEYKEAYPMTTGVAEFSGELALPAGVIGKGAQFIRYVGGIAPRMAGVTAPLAESLATGGFRTGTKYEQALAKAKAAGKTLPADQAGATANMLAKLAGGAGAGATTSAILSGGDIGETAMGGGVGAAVPIVLPVLGKLGYKGAEKLVDLATGQAPKVKAGKIAREAAGENLEAIKNALAQAAEGETAGQAAAYVKQPPFQALAELAERKDKSGETFRQLKEQEVARQQRLAEQSPLLSEAEATRTATTKPIYEMAFTADEQRLARREAERLQRIKEVEESGLLKYSQAYKTKMAEASKLEIPPQIRALRGNPIIDAAAKEASILAKSEGREIGDPMASLRGLHYMKLAIDNQFSNKTAATSLEKYSDRALANTREKLLQAIEGTDEKPGISKVYGVARQKYAELSKPVYQAKIFDELQSILRAPGGVGEKESAFLNVLGAGENALIKKASGQPRFGGLKEALTPEQMAAFRDVAEQLRINTLASEQAVAGRQALSDILAQQKSFRFPWMFGGRATQAANIALDEIADRVGKKTMNALVEGMRSGKSANELLNTLPASERDNLLRAMIGVGRKAPGLGLTTGAAQSQVSREQ